MLSSGSSIGSPTLTLPFIKFSSVSILASNISILSKLKFTKLEITKSISYIKYYDGPSRLWFSYQNSLDEGVARLSKIISELPISIQTTDLIINLLLRLDKKLQSGVDDSNGTVGGFIEETVEVLKNYAKEEPKITKT